MAFNKKKNHRWTVQCSDGEHEIRLEIDDTPRNPMRLLIDEQFHGTLSIENSGGLIPRLEHRFLCDGEELALILYGEKVDLVHRGIFQKSKQKYEPEIKFPKWMTGGFIGVDLASFMLAMLLRSFNGTLQTSYAFCFAMLAAIYVLITIYIATSPFYSFKKKIALGLLSVLCWGLLLFWDLGISWIF